MCVGEMTRASAMPTSRQMAGQEHAPLFEAVIVPHRSLSPRGVRRLIAVLCLLSGLTALRFWLIGAWLVVAFSAAEAGLAVFLIRLNIRRARASELVLLSPEALRIVRTDMRGRRTEQTLSPGWLNVVVRERPGRIPALLLVANGRAEEIAAALAEDEKRDLAAALAAALRSWRNPIFDNPQLRE